MNTPQKKWKLTSLVWLFIFPTITFLFFVLTPFMSEWPFYLRTLILTIILVPLMVFVALPFINKHFAIWLRR